MTGFRCNVKPAMEKSLEVPMPPTVPPRKEMALTLDLRLMGFRLQLEIVDNWIIWAILGVILTIVLIGLV